MNKKIKNILINNYPLISIVILGLIYLYLNTPNNILEQRGGEPTFDYPPNTPFLYKYRFGFVAFPFLLVCLTIYYAYFTYVITPNYTIWDLGLDFFSNFEAQYKIAVSQDISQDDINYKYQIPESMKKSQPELYKFFNMIQLTGSPLSGLYLKSNYFCNSSRPCSCCLDPAYTKYFFGCSDAKNSDKPCSSNEKYKRICQPK